MVQSVRPSSRSSGAANAIAHATDSPSETGPIGEVSIETVVRIWTSSPSDASAGTIADSVWIVASVPDCALANDPPSGEPSTIISRIASPIERNREPWAPRLAVLPGRKRRRGNRGGRVDMTEHSST